MFKSEYFIKKCSFRRCQKWTGNSLY